MGKSLDPENWPEFRACAHDLLDAALDKMQNAGQGRVWSPLPEQMKSELQSPLPVGGVAHADIADRLASLLPYGVGNTHPRFFGWVHGAGNPGGVLADMVASAMNANLGGRDHGAIYVEKQVLDWSRQMMGFPADCGGLITSGTSMGTIVALKVARDRATGFESRKLGFKQGRLVAYASDQAHSCIARALDMLGLGADALRIIPTSADFRMDTAQLARQIKLDRSQGFTPFAVIASAGTVNVGAIDDLDAIATIAQGENIWLHIDGAFGATGMLSDHVRPMLNGLDRADSLAFDFHKWLHVNYSAGCVLIKDRDAQLRAFSDRPDYLADSDRGLAAGAPWPVDFGPELSRGFSALKIWAHFLEHGSEKLGNSITDNCELAQYLARLVEQDPDLILLAPVALNIVCFKHVGVDALNQEIVIQLQEQGIAAPSITVVSGQSAIRVNITNHRTTRADIKTFVEQTVTLGAQFTI